MGWRNQPHNWFVIITNPQCELKAAAELRRAGLRVYVPKRTVEKKNRRTGEVTVKHRPNWAGYLMVRFPEAVRERGVPKFGVARSCQGVKDFVRWMGVDGYQQPIPFPDHLVAAYMRRQRGGDYDGAAEARRIREGRRAGFKPGVDVLIKTGPFAQFLARLEHTKGDIAQLVVEMFGRETPVSVDNFPDNLELVDVGTEAA